MQCGHQVSGERSRCDRCATPRAGNFELEPGGDEEPLELARPVVRRDPQAAAPTPEPSAESAEGDDPAAGEAAPAPDVVVYSPSPPSPASRALEAFNRLPGRVRAGIAGGAALVVVSGIYLALSGPSVTCPDLTQLEKATIAQGTALRCRSELNHRLNGPMLVVDDRGRKSSFTWFKDDQVEGAYESWYPSGTLHEHGEYRKDLKVGTWITYGEDGRKLSQQEMNYGAPDGASETYFPDGSIQVRTSYRRGNLHGTYTRYYSNGQKEEEGTYEFGMKSGSWARYNQAGLLLEETYWVRGQQVKKQNLTAAAEPPEPEPTDPDATASSSIGSSAAAEPRTPVDLENRLFAGRTLEWWRDRIISMKLRSLASPENKTVYELTVHRARLTGLVVEDTPEGTQVRLATPADALPPPTAPATEKTSP